jgi:hypothetical protein
MMAHTELLDTLDLLLGGSAGAAIAQAFRKAQAIAWRKTAEGRAKELDQQAQSHEDERARWNEETARLRTEAKEARADLAKERVQRSECTHGSDCPIRGDDDEE